MAKPTFLTARFEQNMVNRNSSCQIYTVWSSIYLLAISLMGTKSPWYVLANFTQLALAAGVEVAQICPRPASYPRAIVTFWHCYCVVGWVGSFLLSFPGVRIRLECTANFGHGSWDDRPWLLLAAQAD